MAKHVKNIDKLIASLVIDAIGMLSVVGGLTEITDLVWAPISAMLVQKMYGRIGFSIFNGVEEVLWGTDWVPTATLAWLNDEFNII